MARSMARQCAGWQPALVCALLGCLAELTAADLDLPLTVEEPAGVARHAEPVTFGVPLPKGLIKETAELRLYGPDGKGVPAVFHVANRWWDDGSVQWVHTDFLAEVAARGKAVYRLKLSGAPAPQVGQPVRVNVEGDDIRVDTGAARFVAHRRGPFLDAPGLKSADLLLRTDERIYKAGQWQDTQLVVEEASPMKVVLKRTGAHRWADGQDKALDYTLRIVAWAGQPGVRLIYSFVNRQGRNMSEFVRLDGLWLEGKLEKSAAPVRIDQMQAEPRRPGWFEAGGLGVGLKWWWQLYPKEFEVTKDGRLRLAIFPEGARPRNIYAGVAKTHEILLSLDGSDLSAQLNSPLFPAAAPKWYTRDTHAMGRLVESSPDAIRERYWPLVRKYDEWLVKSRDAVLAKRGRGYTFRGERRDEYGMLDFGDAMHFFVEDASRPDYGVHWDTEYYDFPHALFLHFFRTGDRKSLETAIEAAAHLADVDISHYGAEPDSQWPGAPRTGPGLNHWTRYSDGRFISSVSWFVYKNEGLFDRYLLTGDLWSRDVARMSADWGLNFNGLDIQSNTRSIGHGLFAMLKAYEVFGEKKYLDRANWIVDCAEAWQDGDTWTLRRLNPRIAWDPKFKGGFSRQSWMYGIALEGLAQAHQLTGRKEMPPYMKRAMDWVFENPLEWDPVKQRYIRYDDLAVMLTPGLAYISETSGDPKYFQRALTDFERQTEGQRVAEHLKLFAQYFRASQRFLWYLSVEAPGRP